MDIKTPPATPVLGHLGEYRKDPIAFMLRSVKECGYRTKLRFLHKTFYILTHPDDVQQVLVRQAQAFDKGPSMKKMGLIFGRGLLSASGNYWRRNSRMIRPSFTGKEVRRLIPLMRTVIERECVDYDSGIVQLQDRINKLTLDIITYTLFSTNFKNSAQFLNDVTDVMEYITHRLRQPFAPPLWVPSVRNRRFTAVRRRLRSQVRALIQERQRGSEKKHDILQALLDARDEDGSGLSDRQLADEVMTMILAGHETIAGTISFTLILLAQHPEWFDRLRAEADHVWKESEEFSLSSTPQTLACLEESMRLWPAAWSAMRMANQDVSWDGLALKKGDIINLLPLVTHRLGEFWANPLEYRPERFLSGEAANVRPGAFTPFGAGPRACIGKGLAIHEGVLILTYLLSHYTWQIQDERPQDMFVGITLRPTTNTALKFKRRPA